MQPLNLTNVRKKSKLIEQLPWIGRGTGTAVYPNVYVPHSIYDDLHSPSPNPYSVGLVLHEQEHLLRARQHGVVRWYLRNLGARFRFDEEVAAMVPQLAYLKSHGKTYNLERKARMLSGWLYLWSTNYRTAVSVLQDTWDRL